MMIATDSPRCPLPMPMGWFQVLYSHELETGDAIPVEYFEQELVIFRTEDGDAKVVDAFCPHMGAHLGYGIREQTGKGPRIVGDSIECPFHGWRWNGDGQCTHIPYAKNLPPRVAKGEAILSDPELYTADPQRFANISKGLENASAEKDAAEERWLMLAEAVEG